MTVRTAFLCTLAFFGLIASGASAPASEVLVADRLNNSVYRYTSGGAYIAPLILNDALLNQPSGMRLSPDQTKLYVSSSQNSRVVRYDYNYATGTATNGTVFVDFTAYQGASTVASFPNSIAFSPDGNSIYVADLAAEEDFQTGKGVWRFDLQGNLLGKVNGVIPTSAEDSIVRFSGLAFTPAGNLLVGAFQDFPAGTQGAIGVSASGTGPITTLVAPTETLSGVGNLLVANNFLYVSSLFASRVDRYNLTTLARDESFAITGLAFPTSLSLTADGTQLLVGELGFFDGQGRISVYNLDGERSHTFAGAQGNAANGFSEATAIVVAVPEPSGVLLALMAVVCLGVVWRRATSARSA